MIKLKLQPSDVSESVGNWAYFNCSISCELGQTHTIRWFVGYHPGGHRLVSSDFEQRTGIQVVVERTTTCTSASEGMALQRLGINVTSAEMLNKTAVQCAALRKRPSIPDYYSNYAVLIVNGESACGM